MVLFEGMKRPKIVFFLGAGFSAAFGHPVMNGFLDAVRVNDRVDDGHAKALSELVLRARQANSFLQSDPKNIEDILTFAETRARLRLSDEHTALQIRRTLCAIYSTYPDKATLGKLADAFAKLIEYDVDEERRAVTGCNPAGLSFITTNYDLNAEYVLKLLGCSAKLGFCDDDPFKINGRVLYSQNASDAVPIFKLHGAVNWHEGFSPDIGVDDQGTVSTSPYYRAKVSDSKTGDEHLPLIIPPSFLKPQLSKALQSVWAGAARVLGEANYIVFIGYSFPPTDREMAYFLATSLAENTGLSKIFIVDPSADEILRSLRNSRLGNHFLSFIESVQGFWEHCEALAIPFQWRTRQPSRISKYRPPR